MGVLENKFEEWYKRAIDAVEHRDAGVAYRILRTMDDFVMSLDSTIRGNEEFQNEVSILHRQLEYVAFPELPLDRACGILSSEIVSFVMSGINLDIQLSVRYDFTTYGEHEDERMALKKAILSNAEKIGSLTIGEWLQLFDTSFDPETREDRAILDFFTREQRIAELSRREQEILRVVLSAYENWLVVEHLGLIDMANIYGQSSNDDLLPSQSVTRVAPSYEKNPSAKESVYQRQLPNESLPLLPALGKFEKLGGQQVTNSKIVIKGQNDPVRPTIFNWLRAYRDELGVGSHDAVMRGQFLFHSINGKGLSPDERDQVGMLLKSLDENMPITIDAGRQEVVFRKQIADTGYQISDKKQSTNALASEGQSREQIQNTKYKIPNTEQNISRAVFDMPALGRETRDSRPPMDAFSMSENGDDTSSLELGRVTVPPPSHPVIAPRPPAAPVSQTVVPAPRSISFEPAKIDTFSFGASAVGSESSGGMGQYDLKENSHPTFAPAERSNVGSVSFSTNHVLPAEKEKIKDKRYQIPEKRRQEMPLAPQPLTGRMTASPVSKPVQKAHFASSNRYRITPTGRRDDVAPEDAPSPHGVDPRNENGY